MDPKQNPTNYIYFLLSALLLLLLTASHLFIQEAHTESHPFFFVYAIGQILLELSLFSLITFLTIKYLGKIASFFFIGFTFIVLTSHFIDFFLHRILDLSTWKALNVFVFSETLENFLYLLAASDIPSWGWILIFASIAIAPLIGYFGFWVCHHFSKIRQLHLTRKFYLQIFVSVPCALFLWELLHYHSMDLETYGALVRTLPWKTTYLQPQATYLSTGPIRLAKTENELRGKIEQESSSLENKPNIYLFVIESLREDAITKEIAPNLFQFKQDFVHFEKALSNANASHLSWFSIFHSEFPLFWQERQKNNWSMGSAPLQLLKKWGYQIRLYSSADLGFYKMDTLLFGKDQNLLSSKKHFPHQGTISAADSDTLLINTLKNDLNENKDLHRGQVFIIFLDGTHFNYSWPTHWTPKFTPVAEHFSYFQMFPSKTTVQAIKNRYHSALNYTDHLFGTFFHDLVYRDESIVAITGDHGEEFFDQGHLFHLSHLSIQQTHVPLYLKFGNQKIQGGKIASQMDIFPSILDFVAGKSIALTEGNSLFSNEKWPFVVTARFNAGATPTEFALHNEQHKLIAQFDKETFESKRIKVISYRNLEDIKVPLTADVATEFKPAFNRLFVSENQLN